MIDPIEVVRRQVDAFNAHDVAAFLATYSSDAKVTGAAEADLIGRDAMKRHYQTRLVDRSLHCTLRTVLLLGDRWVVAHEAVTSSQAEVEVVAVFDVADGLIRRASLTRA